MVKVAGSDLGLSYLGPSIYSLGNFEQSSTPLSIEHLNDRWNFNNKYAMYGPVKILLLWEMETGIPKSPSMVYERY